MVFPRLLGGPNQMKLGSAPVSVLVQVAVFIQTRERGRIGHPFVEIADFLSTVHLSHPRMSGAGADYTVRTRLAHFSGKHLCSTLIDLDRVIARPAS